jgi:hypothetical protein
MADATVKPNAMQVDEGAMVSDGFRNNEHKKTFDVDVK